MELRVVELKVCISPIVIDLLRDGSSLEMAVISAR